MMPGPALATSLSAVDRSQLNGHHLVSLLQAQARQNAHLQAEMLATMVEIAQCPPGTADSAPERCTDPQNQIFAADEIRAALCLTRRTADYELGLAWQLRERLPRVWDTLHAGEIDLRRARAIVNGVAHLPEETARRVVKEIIAEAPELTTGQLAARIRRLCIQVDPDDARHRYQEGLAERRIGAEANPDGTAGLYGLQLPPHRVNAIRRKINRLAKSLKTADDPRTIDQIRADVFLDLLQGTTSGSDKASRATVDVQVDLKTLAGLSQNPGTIPGWGPVIADIARQIVEEQPSSRWRITVTETDNGQVLWTGLTKRRPNTNQQRLIETRQPTCVFPGCRMPSTECDFDHTQPWAHGGPTTVDNLAPLCRSNIFPPSTIQRNKVGGKKYEPRPPPQTPSRLAPEKNRAHPIHVDEPTRTHLYHHRSITLISP
jgi:hypothetical protein